jgi:recombinational DNA repair protein (RecF pathway)
VSDIPPEHWPRCLWCGEFLDEVSLEVETSFNRKRCICSECRDIIDALIAENAPFYLGEFLSHYADSDERLESYPHHRNLSPEDLEKMAREAMLKNGARELSPDAKEKLEALAKEKSQTVSELVSEIVSENTKRN